MHTALQVTAGGFIEASALALVLVAATTGLHYEAVRALLHRFHGLRMSHPRLVRLVVELVLIHSAEVALYAGAYAFGAAVLGIGGLTGGSGHGVIDFTYFAAETYSTLGYGDLVPTGGLRVIACVEAINGVLLLTLSGAFVSALLRDSYLRDTQGASGGG